MVGEHPDETPDASAGPGPADAGASAGGGPGTCLACRGTGRLISGLGGTPHEVGCPWCRGTGSRIPGINAQDAPAETAPPGTRAGTATTATGTAE